MMKFIGLLYVVIVFASAWAVTAQVPFDCGSSNLDPNMPRFTSLTVFPAKVQVGDQVHVRTVVQLPGINAGDIKDGTLSMELKFKGATFASIAGIPLCNASSSIVCSALGPTDNAISFDYTVPEIPIGLYSIKLLVSPDKTTKLSGGCLTFDVTVVDSEAETDKYVSWIEGQLAGVAQFEHEDYMQRSIGEIIQIGPIGSVTPVLAYTFPWGTFINLAGSGDLIQPGFNTGGYVWGLNGEMDQMTYQSTAREHVYHGDFYVGYVSSLAKRTLDVEILTGTFALTWAISQDGVITSNLTGNISFDSTAELPFGFSNPITVGRLGSIFISTNTEGILVMKGQQNICLDDPDCNENFGSPANSDDDLEGWQIGLITGIIVGVALIFVVVIALWKWHKRTKRYEEEDGIFSAARKPEYGNALVVDDIIQETREHSPHMMPPLSRDRGQDFSDSESDYSRSRSRSRSPESYRSRSASPPRSRSRSASRSYSDSESDYTDAGSSASRA